MPLPNGTTCVDAIAALYALLHGWSGLAGVQVLDSPTDRDVERHRVMIAGVEDGIDKLKSASGGSRALREETYTIQVIIEAADNSYTQAQADAAARDLRLAVEAAVADNKTLATTFLSSAQVGPWSMHRGTMPEGHGARFELGIVCTAAHR